MEIGVLPETLRGTLSKIFGIENFHISNFEEKTVNYREFEMKISLLE